MNIVGVYLRKYWKICLGSLLGIGVFCVGFFPHQAHAGNFMSDFGLPLLQEGGWGDERAWGIEGVSYDNTFIENVRALFYPGDGGGAIWILIRNIAIGLLIVLFVWAGAYLMLYGHNPERQKQGLLNLLYLIIGAIIFFLALWIIEEGLNFGGFSGLSGDNESLLKAAEDNIFFLILSVLKGVAFFAAILFIAYYGYSIITTFSSDEKWKNAKQGILNVILALIFIKIIDFIYFIALQDDFKTQAVEFIVEVSKGLGYILGFLLVIAVIYAGYMMATASGDKDQISQAGTLLKNIFITVLVLMLFLLIIYQIFNDVVG